jgi:hypothetical protein
MSIANAAFTGIFVAEMLFKWLAVGGQLPVDACDAQGARCTGTCNPDILIPVMACADWDPPLLQERLECV